MIKELILAASFSSELAYLTEATYHEARGEGRCQYYVAGVIKNRMLHEYWPDTIEGVIKQANQFEYRSLPDLNMYETDASEYAERVAYSVITSANKPSFNNIVFFHTTTSDPHWASEMKEELTCGNHVFYSMPTG